MLTSGLRCCRLCCVRDGNEEGVDCGGPNCPNACPSTTSLSFGKLVALAAVGAAVVLVAGYLYCCTRLCRCNTKRKGKSVVLMTTPGRRKPTQKVVKGATNATDYDSSPDAAQLPTSTTSRDKTARSGVTDASAAGPGPTQQSRVASVSGGPVFGSPAQRRPTDGTRDSESAAKSPSASPPVLSARVAAKAAKSRNFVDDPPGRALRVMPAHDAASGSDGGFDDGIMADQRAASHGVTRDWDGAIVTNNFSLHATASRVPVEGASTNTGYPHADQAISAARSAAKADQSELREPSPTRRVSNGGGSTAKGSGQAAGRGMKADVVGWSRPSGAGRSSISGTGGGVDLTFAPARTTGVNGAPAPPPVHVDTNLNRQQFRGSGASNGNTTTSAAGGGAGDVAVGHGGRGSIGWTAGRTVTTSGDGAAAIVDPFTATGSAAGSSGPTAEQKGWARDSNTAARMAAAFVEAAGVTRTSGGGAGGGGMVAGKRTVR